MNRREFLKAGVSTVPLITGTSGFEELANAASLATDPLSQDAGSSELPWQRRIHRVGQTNMTEHDPAVMDVEGWADYWSSMQVGATFISVTGILAYYQTKVPFHKKGRFLGNRDFFGECCAAARKRGLRVVARMSPDLNWEETMKARPEWFEREANGNFIASKEEPRLYRTCMYSSYMTDYVPAIMREINSLYAVDAFYTNGWPPIGSLPACSCDECRQLPPSGTPAYWEKFNDRIEYLWKLYESEIRKKNPAQFYFPNLGGGARCSVNLARLGRICQWFQGDNQGRGGEDRPVWLVTQQGRVCQAVMEGKTATNVTGAWSTGPIRWRNVAKPWHEMLMWLNQTNASGMVPYYHIVGGEKGLGEDRRELSAARDYFVWTAKHDVHFTNKRTIANLGVVLGQRTHLFYKTQADATMLQFLDGMYTALLEGRFLFDFVHEDTLEPERLNRYAALILPNVALLSDAQCEALRAYVQSGGSLLATFETSLYDESNRSRSEFGLADVFGIHKTGDIVGTTGNAFYARIERHHDILDGFAETNWLPGAQYRVPLAPVDNPVLTVVPGFVAYPPELAYPPTPQTSEPAVVLRQRGKSRTAYFPSDIERSLWVSGHTDLSRVVQNTIRWLVSNQTPVSIEGAGLVESFAYETQAGFALHLLNYTNPNTHRGSLRNNFPIGPQAVRFEVPAGRSVSRVQLLKQGTDIPFQRMDNVVTFTVPSVVDYEVAAIYAEAS